MRINGVQNAFDKLYFEALVMRLNNGVIHFGLDNTKMQQYRLRTENYPIVIKYNIVFKKFTNPSVNPNDPDSCRCTGLYHSITLTADLESE